MAGLALGEQPKPRSLDQRHRVLTVGVIRSITAVAFGGLAVTTTDDTP